MTALFEYMTALLEYFDLLLSNIGQVSHDPLTNGYSLGSTSIMHQSAGTLVGISSLQHCDKTLLTTVCMVGVC